jgi:uncharacterized protein
MSDSSKAPLSPELLLHIAKLLNVSMHALTATIALLDEGGTIPFIARYRKEATGALNEVQIREIEEKLGYFRDLVSRRETILASIAEQGKLSGELKAKLELCLDKSELEDLYLPYRPKRRTKATIAREKGLEPLADYIWSQAAGDASLLEIAAGLVDVDKGADKGVASLDEALEGARHIVAERIAETAELRKATRQLLYEEGMIASRVSVDGEAKDAQGKFRMYYDFREPVKTIPSHRMLAIRRGEAEGVLYFLIELPTERATGVLRQGLLRQQGDWTPQLELAIDDCWTRLLSSSIQGELRLELKRRSDTEAIHVFRDNLHHLLLAAPAGPISVLGIDPGLRTGCKVAVVDETGRFLAQEVIYPHTGQTARAAATLAALVKAHQVRAIAIGNGTASRETDAFVRDFLAEQRLTGLFKVTVSEAGASVYSASEIARQEFPDLDLTVRGAISIARRLQDPLSELVKVDPKAIGVGQYQHDVDQRQLQQSLEATIESCVNKVGVDLNTSSWTLLRYIAGISERTALNIVKFRDEHGRFTSRKQLMKVPGVGAKTFEQAAGFLRIRDGEQPLDSTAVHPESYALVEQIAAAAGAGIAEVIANPALLGRVDKSRLEAGAFTLNDILEELRKPGRDPRDTFVAPAFHEGVKEVGDLVPEMMLEGVVTNVTKFGAFVDLGVHQDGLVHISELSNRYVKDPGEVVKAGQIVKVRVLNADVKTRRIALSMKMAAAPKTADAAGTRPQASTSQKPQPAPPAKRPQPQQKVPAPMLTMEEKMAALSTRWKVR